MRLVAALVFASVACAPSPAPGNDAGPPDAGGVANPEDGGAPFMPDAGSRRGLFEAAEPWTRDVSGLPKAGESDTIIGALAGAGGWGTGDFRIDFSITLQGADANTPRRTFTPKDDAWAEATLGDSSLAEFYRPDCEQAEVPVPVGGALEGEDGYACENDGDCHLLVVATDEHRLYEMWRADLRGTTFLGGCLATWDLTRAYGESLRGRGCTSADAGGFPIAGMLVTPEEVASGDVPHALRFILPNARIRRGIYVPPGTHSTFATRGGADLPPYGVLFRLKAGFDLSKLPTEGARTVARALQKHGMYLADGGSVPLTFASDRGRSVTWEAAGVGARSLDAIGVGDFEVVDFHDPVNWLANTDCSR